MNAKQPYYFDEMNIFHEYWGDMVASIFLATIGYLAFEVPFTTIEGYVYKKIQEKRKQVSKM
jgi:hypothetical protein